jgi:hypothetical protein
MEALLACVCSEGCYLACCAAQDFKNIQEGVYKLPWDMTTRGHRQWSPLWVARRSAQVPDLAPHLFIHTAHVCMSLCCLADRANMQGLNIATAMTPSAGTMPCQSMPGPPRMRLHQYEEQHPSRHGML